jgi:diketogulonate reductase-like aldo/keto reductase
MKDEDVIDDQRTCLLADGKRMPTLGFGVWQVPNGQECVDAVRCALDAGYRHVDTAQAYGNEESVGRALAESGIPRDEIFITTKFFPRSADPVAEAERSLDRLGVDRVDLYIIHWPEGGPTWAWPGMERAKEIGLTASIGVSNFDVDEITALLSVANTPPVVNQVQFSPFEYRGKLLEHCTTHAIALEAYSPLGTGRHLDNEVIASVAEKIGRTPAQVLLRWGIQHGLVVLPKSTHKSRIVENALIFDFVLGETEMVALDSCDATGSTAAAREAKWWESSAR